MIESGRSFCLVVDPQRLTDECFCPLHLTCCCKHYNHSGCFLIKLTLPLACSHASTHRQMRTHIHTHILHSCNRHTTWHRGATALLLSTNGSVGKACPGTLQLIAKWLCGKNTTIYTHTHTREAGKCTQTPKFKDIHLMLPTLPFLLLFRSRCFSSIWTRERQNKGRGKSSANSLC